MLAALLGSQLLVVVCSINASLYISGTYLSWLLRRLWTVFTSAPPSLLRFAEVCSDTLLPLRYSTSFSSSPSLPLCSCLAPPSGWFCGVLQRWQRERRTDVSLVSNTGWTWANHSWRCEASRRRRQLADDGYPCLHIWSAYEMAWFRLLLIHRHLLYQVYLCCQIHTQAKAFFCDKDAHSKTHIHTNSLTCLSTGPLVFLPCLWKRLHTQAGHVIFSPFHCLFFLLCLGSIWHKVDRHVSCACGLLLFWKFIF